ncbi:FAR1-related sequence 10, partial [Tanacetum coccineum]
MLNVGSTEGSCDQQALETDRIQLQDMITSLRIQLDGLKVENVSLKRRYDELSQANTHSRTANTEKLSALTAENTKLKAQVTGKTSSGPSTSEKPKVLASGIYNVGSKYIPPPKRANWVKPTPLPKKKQVTFQEPPRTSNRPTQKPPVQQNKKPNVSVNLPTRTKPATEPRKPMPKSDTRNHRIWPSKSENARRAAIHNRNLNFDHNQFVIRSLKSVNTKTPQAKHNGNHTKKLRETTGRHFGLVDTCPLTRIVEPIVEPLELTPSVSSSFKVTMISRSKGRTVADSIDARLTRPTVYKFKTDCSIIPVWALGIRGTSLSRAGKPVKKVLLMNLSDHRCSIHTVIIDPHGIRAVCKVKVKKITKVIREVKLNQVKDQDKVIKSSSEDHDQEDPETPTRMFRRIYVCLGALKRGFREDGRELLGLDGEFMIGHYPVAYGIVESENQYSWTWFLKCLGDDFDLYSNSNFTFITDRQKGLLPALAKLFPSAEHRYCCATSTTEVLFEKNMQYLKDFNKKAYEWLHKIPPEHWSRAYFSGRAHCELLINNVCEVFNRQLLDARDSLIITALEFVREYLMKRIMIVQKVIQKCYGQLTPAVAKLFDKIKVASTGCTMEWNGSELYQVKVSHQEQYVVNLTQKTYSCRKWEISGIPCKHAIAVIHDMTDNG